MSEFLINQNYQLQKFPGKGGWTYAEIPEIVQNKDNPFGWVTVSGWIDNYELKQYKLMPKGNGKLFLPVKAGIRKAIGKQAGDWVQLKLKVDDSPTEIPQELLDCFALEDKKLLHSFQSLTDGEKKTHIDYIFSAKTEETKAKRIADLLTKLGNTI